MLNRRCIAYLVIFLSAVISSLFLYSYTGGIEGYSKVSSCNSYCDICVYFCNVSPSCPTDFRYGPIGVFILYPFAFFGFHFFVISVMFLVFFIPSVLLYMKTRNTLFSLSWMVLNFPSLLGAGMYAQALAIMSVIPVLLFNEELEHARWLKYLLLIFCAITHQYGWILALYVLLINEKGLQRIFENKIIPVIVIPALVIASIILMLFLPTPFDEMEAITSSLYFIWVLFPLMCLSINGQDTKLQNKALITYLLIIFVSLGVMAYYTTSHLSYTNFIRVIGLLDLFTLIFIASGRHDSKILNMVFLFLLMSKCYRFVVNPVNSMLWNWKVL